MLFRETSNLLSLACAVALSILPISSWTSRSYGQEVSLADLIEQTEKSVVRIEVQGRNGSSLGSGFIVDAMGTMITNCHVLAGATSATIQFPNGERGTVLGTYFYDPSRDIAVTKVTVRAAPALPLANKFPRKGETVTALGSPHGLSFTATNGIVSAIRPGEEIAAELSKPKSDNYGTWIQVDAAISPGNSGGPLINRRGEVVAMCTLASQGSAQNLNFGISAKDINEVIADSVPRGTLTALRDGIANVRMPESGGGNSPGGSTSPPAIPEDALHGYISMGQSEFGELVRGLRMESARLGADLKEMRKGTPQIPPAFRANDAAVAVAPIPGKKGKRWFFRDQLVKEEVLKVQQNRIRDYNRLKNQLRSNEDAKSMFELLWNFGPPLDPRKNQSIGFATDLFVVRAFNDNELLASLDGRPYLVRIDSTVGLASGEILSGPTFVAGTVTIRTSDGLPSSLTVLQIVSESELRTAIDEQIGSAGLDGFRTWRDLSGSYSVEAKLLGQDAVKVVLQKRDGSIVNVPKSKLSQKDQDFLELP